MHAAVSATYINRKNNTKLSLRLRIKALYQTFVYDCSKLLWIYMPTPPGVVLLQGLVFAFFLCTVPLKQLL